MSSCCSTLTNDSRESEAISERAGQWLRLGIAGLIASQTMILSLAANLSTMVTGTRLMLHGILAASAIGVFVYIGFPLVKEAWKAAYARRIVIEQLFLLGIIGALAASLIASVTGKGAVYYEVVSILLGIYVFGKLMGEKRKRSVEASSFQISRQFSLCHRIKPDGTTQDVTNEEISIGESIIVHPRESIPIDGVVIEGLAYVQETPLTGELLPRVKREGDCVLAGSQVVDSKLIIQASSSGSSRQLDQLTQEIRSALARPAPMQRQADLLVSWFLPVVVTASLLTFVVWMFVSSWTTALFHSMSVLLVACPCAMGLATPIAQWGALNALVLRGWRVKSAGYVESLAGTDTVVFDKTGTLSEESLGLIDFVTEGRPPRAKLLSWVTALQRQNPHPLARAFHGLSLRDDHEVILVEPLPSIGMRATIRDCESKKSLLLEIGNDTLLESGDLPQAEKLRRQLIHKDYTHEVWIKVDHQLCAMAQLRETLRDSAHTLIEKLEGMGIAVLTLTGDTVQNAQRLGLGRVEGSLTASEKANRIRELQKQGHHVLYVGDGINDAPSLAAANTSLTLAHASTLAQASSGATIPASSLGTISEAIQLARQTVQGIRVNLLFAGMYNVLGMVLAAVGILHPVVAALLMLAASFTVTTRALRFATSVQPNRRDHQSVISFKDAARRLRCHLRPLPAVLAAGIMLQALLLAHLGQAPHGVWGVFIGVSLVLALLTLLLWPSIQNSPAWQMTVSMLALGNLGMLIGWWADAGFGPVIRDGVCLCGCPKSSLGQGLFLRFSLMHASIPLTAFPLMLMVKDPASGLFRSRIEQWMHGLFVSIGMLLGMWLAAGCMSLIPVVMAKVQFNLTYAAMAIGMLLGMFAGCILWRLNY